MAKYHISPKTGNPNVCNARWSCPFGDIDDDHYGTKEEARKAYEQEQEAAAKLEARKEALRKKAGVEIPPRSKWVGGHYMNEPDIIDGREGHWNTSVTIGTDRYGMRKPSFVFDDAGMQDPLDSLPNSFPTDEWKSVERPAVMAGDLVGLEGAQEAFLRNAAREAEDGTVDKYSVFEGPISKYTDEFVRRSMLDEKSEYDYDVYQRNFLHMPPKEKLFYALTEEDSNIMSSNVLYSALTFPEKDLYPVLKRLGVENVSVSVLNNSRETGLIYTVLTPTGATRSFMLYEHRNSNSLIINGQENWAVEEKPYGPYPEAEDGSTSKNNFFAEFRYDTPKRQVAETLGYFLKSAQSGTLESDQQLIAKAEKLDWGAILSKQIPSFGVWLESKKKERHESQDFLDKSFKVWESDFE